MAEKYLETDLNVPEYLIRHYYISGSVCTVMNSLVIYLLLFHKGKLDNFRYYLLAFQINCFLTDFHLSFLMQLVPFFPYIVGGFAIGAFPSLSLLTPHYCMTILSFLVGFQTDVLAICFIRKHRAISRVSGKYQLTERMFKLLILSCLLIPFTFSVPFYLTGNTEEEKFRIIDEKYPLYRSKFENLTNFEIYELTVWMQTFSTMVMVGCVHAVTTVTVLTRQMYRALISCSRSLSKATLEKHRSALRSLVGQFMTTPIAMLPPAFIVSTIVIPFDGAQELSWYMLMVMTTHSTINCFVVILTFPEFRAYVFFWSKEGKRHRKRIVVSGPVSLVSTRTIRTTFTSTLT